MLLSSQSKFNDFSVFQIYFVTQKNDLKYEENWLNCYLQGKLDTMYSVSRMTFQAYEKGLWTVFKAEERCRQAVTAHLHRHREQLVEPPGGLLGRLWLLGSLSYTLLGWLYNVPVTLTVTSCL